MSNSQLLQERFAGLALTQDEYNMLVNSSTIPDFLNTVIGGNIDLEHYPEGARYSGDFAHSIDQYRPKLYMEEYVEGSDYQARTGLVLFPNMLVITYIPEYEATKKRYAITMPIVKAVAIPLCKVTGAQLRQEADSDQTIKYLYDVIFEDGSVYTALLFTVRGNQILRMDNWTLSMNMVIHGKTFAGKALNLEELVYTSTFFDKVFSSYLKSAENYQEREKLVYRLYDKEYAKLVLPALYAKEDAFLEAITSQLSHLTFSEEGRELSLALAPYMEKKKAAESRVTAAEAAYELKRKRLWGIGLLRGKKARREMEALEASLALTKKKVLDVNQEIYGVCRDILGNNNL